MQKGGGDQTGSPPSILIATVAQTSADCTIDGSVVWEERSAPIPNVMVSLVPRGSFQAMRTATSDEEGHFIIQNVSPGDYVLRWRREGYFSKDDDVNYPTSSSNLTLRISAQQHIENVVLSLIPGGIVSGRIANSQGKLIARGRITALAISYEQGRRVLKSVGRSADSDDRGEYRLFGLRPGQYYLMSEYIQRNAIAGATFKSFFPGVSNATEALPVNVVAGGETTDVTFRVVENESVTIAGMLLDNPREGNSEKPEPKSPTATMPVYYLTSNDPGGISTDPILLTNVAPFQSNLRDGAFEFQGVPKGRHELWAFLSEGDFLRFAHVPLDVRQSIVNLRLVMMKSFVLKGKIDLPAGEALNGRDLQLQTADVIPGSIRSIGMQSASLNPDGTFLFSNLLDLKYLIFPPIDLNKDEYISDVLQENVSVFRDGISVGDNSAPIRVVIEGPGGMLRVKVETSNQKPGIGATITLIPEAEYRKNSLLFVRAMAGPDGIVPLISGIRPGKYRLFAWSEIPAGAEKSPEFLRPFESYGTPIVIERGKKIEITVNAIPGL
jgi:hypothetical protein